MIHSEKEATFFSLSLFHSVGMNCPVKQKLFYKDRRENEAGSPVTDEKTVYTPD